jgi:hypothetical protein
VGLLGVTLAKAFETAGYCFHLGCPVTDQRYFALRKLRANGSGRGVGFALELLAVLQVLQLFQTRS